MKLEMTAQQLNAIARLVLYMRDDEKEHYEEMVDNGEDVSGHIFTNVSAVADWLEDQPGDPLGTLDREYLREMQARWMSEAEQSGAAL